MTNSVIALREISKSYSRGRHRTRVLHGVSLTARAGEITTIIGPSGSGKTTLLRIMGGLLPPDHGVVSVNGQPLYGTGDRALSRYRNTQIGFIFQDYRLLPNYNALDNVRLPLVIAGIGRREQLRRARHALDLVGLGGQLKQRVEHLSGGQEQRVGIARALAMQPSVLIADEPTGNLDSSRSADIMALFQRLRADQGVSIVMVTHDERIAGQADRVVTLVDGRIQVGSYAAA